MQDLVSIVESIGFPIFICLYLLVRFEKKFDQLNSTIMSLHDAVLLISEYQKNEKK